MSSITRGDPAPIVAHGPEVLAKLLQVAEGLVARLPPEIIAKYQYVRTSILASDSNYVASNSFMTMSHVNTTTQSHSGVLSPAQETGVKQAIALLGRLQNEMTSAIAQYGPVFDTFDDLLPATKIVQWDSTSQDPPIQAVLRATTALQGSVHRHLRAVERALATAGEATNIGLVREQQSTIEKLNIELDLERDNNKLELLRIRKECEIETRNAHEHVESLNAQIAQLTADLEQAKNDAQLAESMADELDNAVRGLDNRCARLKMSSEDWRSRCVTLKEKLGTRAQELVAQLQSEHDVRVRVLESQHTAAMEKLISEHAHARDMDRHSLESKEREWSDKLQQTVLDLEVKHRGNLDAVQMEANRVRDQQDHDYRAEIHALREKHKEDTYKASERHAEEIRRISERHRAECAELRSSQATALIEREEANREGIDHLQTQFLQHEKELLDLHAQDMAKQSEAFRAQRESIQAMRDQERKEHERECLKWADRFTLASKEHEKRINELEASKNAVITQLERECELLEQRIPDNFDLASVFATMDDLVSEHRKLEQTNKILKRQNRQLSHAMALQTRTKKRGSVDGDSENLDPRLLHDSQHIALKAQKEFASAHERLQRTLTDKV